ncbi:MAG TPA: Uma2 family endonuclease [Ardenticatenaceae bacterium]
MSTSPRPPLTKEWPEQGQWTYEDWARLPDDGTRYEVIDGVLYMAPPPNTAHQSSSNRLANAMTNHADLHGLGHVFTAPIGVQLPDHPVPVQPDILFIGAGREGIIGGQYVEGTPDLVVEILSPSNWSYDREEKFRLYEEAGVPEYWIVDPRIKSVEVFVLEAGEYVLLGKKWGEGGTAVSRVLAGFEIPVASIFRNL